jgi:hypothetical protein
LPAFETSTAPFGAAFGAGLGGLGWEVVGSDVRENLDSDECVAEDVFSDGWTDNSVAE